MIVQDRAEFHQPIDLNGNSIEQARFTRIKRNGFFIDETRNNPDTGVIEIWNGTAWVAGDGTFSYKVIDAPSYGGGRVVSEADPNRHSIALDNGVGVRINSTKGTTTAVVSVAIDTSIAMCNGSNIFHVMSSVADAAIMTNNGFEHKNFLSIQDAITHISSLPPSGDGYYLIVVQPGLYEVQTQIDIPGNIKVQLSPNAIITGHGNFRLTTGSHLTGNGDIGIRIDVVGTGSTIEARNIARIGVAGWANIKCTRLGDLYVSVSEYDAYYVNVDCIEIGNVRTGFDNVDDESYQPYPNIIQAAIGGANVNVYCKCTTHGTEWSCPYGTKCMVGPALMGSISEELKAYYSKRCMLSIRANKRVDNSKVLVSVGNVKMSYHSYVNTFENVSDVYVSGLSGAWEKQTTLSVSDAYESAVGLGYQVGDGAILRLNNVRHYSLTDGMPANIAQVSDESFGSRVSLRDTVLCSMTASALSNIHGVQANGFNLLELASFNSYGNNSTPAVNCNQVLGTSLGYTPIQQDIWV